MKYLLIFLTMIFFVGCGSKVKILELEPSTKLSSPTVSLEIPNSFPNIPWIMFGTKYFNDDNKIYFYRHLPNMMSEDVRATVITLPKESIPKADMLHKRTNDQMEENEKNYKVSDWEKKNNVERGVGYLKRYVDFIGGLKCATRVESSNIAMGVGTKSYQTNCNYFDNLGGAKIIHFDYSYTYAHSNTKFDGDKSSSNYSAQTMQLQFKQDIKKIFDSLVIHDMDREKMSKEGLLHNKKYDIETEEKTPNNIGK